MGLILLIAGAIALGALVAYAVVVTIKWLKNKITQIFANRRVKKVAAMDLQKLIDECPNQKTLDSLMDDGYDMVLASVDDSGQVQDVEVVRNTGREDPEVDRLLGDEQMVVVTR